MLYRLLRPKHYVKNVFVLAPLFFSGLLKEHALSAVCLAGMAFVCFCLWSSAVYILNDICDRERDRLHPRKCQRPIASGKVSIPTAVVLDVLCFLLPFVLVGSVYFCTEGILSLHALGWFLLAGGLYLLNNVLYCTVLRLQVILDVFSIALGFIFRVLGGCFILSVEPSPWILVCTFSLALFLGFSKRRMELNHTEVDASYRASLSVYSVEFLNILLGVSMTVCVMAYMLYTLSSTTVELHNTQHLIYTVPFVFYGTFRYLLTTIHGQADGPVEAILRDWLFQINALLWFVVTVVLLYC